eukprot:3322439-Amphidinium_carterae.1
MGCASPVAKHPPTVDGLECRRHEREVELLPQLLQLSLTVSTTRLNRRKNLCSLAKTPRLTKSSKSHISPTLQMQ